MIRKPEDKTHIVKAEGNFEDHPYFRVGDGKGDDGVLTHVGIIRTKDGHELKQSWTVRAAQGLGLPGRFDQDVYVALLQLIDKKGGVPADGWIRFSLYELMEFLGRDHHGGRDYRQVKESLDRLSLTGIQSVNAFYHKSTQSYITDSFHLLDRVKHSETNDAYGKRNERTQVKLSQYFVESYKADYLKGLDADFYWSLNSAVAKRLYRLVDKKRGNHRRWESEIFALRDRIPLSNYSYPSKVKEKLEPAHQELLQKGFLEKVSYRKIEKRVTFVCYQIREDFAHRRPALQLEATPETVLTIERLKSEGVRADVAEELVAKHGPERCLHYAEALPFQKNVKKPAGWLRRAIEEGYDLDMPPAGELQARRKFAKPKVIVGSSSELDTPPDSSFDDPPPIPLPEPDPAAKVAAEEVWPRVLAAVEHRIDAPSFRVWFHGTFPRSLEGSTLTIVVPNDFAKQYIGERFKPMLEEALAAEIRPSHRGVAGAAPSPRLEILVAPSLKST